MMEAMFQMPKRRVERVFLHCSAWDDPPGEELLGVEMHDWIEVLHTKAKSEGGLGLMWSEIGYQYLIDSQGERIAGRSLEKIPAAQRGNNTGTIAIMVHGLKRFAPAALNECAQLCREINMAYSGRISFHGHCEVSIKSCPVFNYHGLLHLDRWQRMP